MCTELGARPSGRSRWGAVYPRSARESEHGGSRENWYQAAHGGIRISEEWTTLETPRAEVTAMCTTGVSRPNALGHRRRTYQGPRQASCIRTPGARVGSRMTGCRDRVAPSGLRPGPG